MENNTTWEERFDELGLGITEGVNVKILGETTGIEIPARTKLKAFIASEIAVARADEADKCNEHIAKAQAETAKAYGGCESCFGKGYATVIERVYGRGEADIGNGDIEIDYELPRYRPCQHCDRGRQFANVLTTLSTKTKKR